MITFPRAFCLGTALAVCSVVSAAPLFRDPLPVDLGIGQNGDLVIADFTGDSLPDLAVGNVSIVPGKAGGPFAAPIVTPMESFARRSAAADLNGDGKQDLVRIRAAELSVLLGNGNGTFTAGATVSTIPEAGPLALADFTGDGKLDALTASGDPFSWSGERRFALHAGNGAGGFAAAVTIVLGNGDLASEILAADLNGDGRADAVTEEDGLARVYLSSNGKLPSFPSWSTSVGHDAFGTGSFTLGHLNADSVVDLVVGNFDGLHTFAGNGNGSFTPLATYAVPVAERVAIADMNNDGKHDIVALGRTASILLGNGAGAFSPPVHFRVPGSSSFAVADFDGDGKRDVVSVPAATTRGVFAKGNGDGTLALDRSYLARAPSWTTETSHQPVVADVDGDAKPDVIIVVSATATADQISVLRNDGSGGLRDAVATGAGARVAAYTAGRIDSDAFADVVVLRSDTAAVISFFGRSGGTLVAGPASSIDSADAQEKLRLADVDGDGKTDLVTYARYYPGNGSGGFGAARTSNVKFGQLADLDGDGAVDAIWNDGSVTSVGLNDGSGTFTVNTFPSTGALRPVADFTGDGKPDLAAAAAEVSDVAWRTMLTIQAGNGDGTFGESVKTVVDGGSGFSAPVAADFDGDGHLDLLDGDQVLLGNGDAHFRDLVVVGAVTMTAADMDGNGRADVVKASQGIVTVLRSGLAPAPFADPAVEAAAVPGTSSYAEEMAWGMTLTNTTPRPVTGSATLRVDGTPVAVLQVLRLFEEQSASGQVSLLRAFGVGAHTMTLTYNGDLAYRPASVSFDHTVNRAPTSIDDVPSLFTTMYGAGVSVRPVLNFPTVPYLPGASGAAAVFSGGVELPQSQSGHTILEYDVGTWPFTAKYEGDANYEPATVPFTLKVNQANMVPGFSVFPSRNQRLAGQPVSFFVWFPVISGGYGELTGTVTLFVNEQLVETRTVVDRQATFTTTLPGGAHGVRIEYSGDANHLATASSTNGVEVYDTWETPMVLQATVRGTVVELRWTLYREALFYTVYRKRTWAEPWTEMQGSGWFTESMPLNATWMYKVEARRSASVTRATPTILVTTVAFTDPGSLAGVKIKRAHVAQLRTSVNAVRAFAGLAQAAFTDATPSIVKEVHIAELRTALSQARSAIGMPVTFTDPALTARTSIIRAVHIEELRSATR